MTSKLGLEILERGERVWRGEKRRGKMGKGGNELKYQFQKYPNSVHLHSFSAERAWWVQAPCRRQPVLRVTVWMTRWYHKRAGRCKTCSSCCSEMLYSWGWNSPAAEVTKSLLLIIVYQNCILLLSIMLCCTGKYLFPLLTHMAVEKEVCPRGPWLVSRLQPPAIAMLSEGKTGTCHLLLYQLLFNRNHLLITKQYI